MGMDKGQLLTSGAEGSVYSTEFLGRPAIAKVRFPKKYRNPELDSTIRSRRIRSEARLLREARAAGVRTPVVYFADLAEGALVMENVEGETVKSRLDTRPEEADALCRRVGEDLARLHDADIAHGDLTTSNILVCPDGRLCFIDFSMGTYPADDEAIGVDIRLLERAFSSAHPGMEGAYKALIDSYSANKKDSAKVMDKVREIKERGRYT